ncbi:hypothetical protein TNIN_171821 [Trichonephila inaurata madagascariensis]|uniref:Uncharacterized protein n=1 Tax=Trichonephila inaurata madagascariensis TaxID=2747483 RepID=A0A8X6WN64_9ARAC|nr:hypothetical protein TNIN_171821 [Trichonephila inaurata madagascariensis]
MKEKGESFVRPSTIPNPRDPEENPLIRRIGRAGKVFLRPFPLTLKSRLFRWLSVAEDLEDGMRAKEDLKTNKMCDTHGGDERTTDPVRNEYAPLHRSEQRGRALRERKFKVTAF